MKIQLLQLNDLDNFLKHYERTLNESGAKGIPVFNLYQPGEFKINDQIRELFQTRLNREMNESNWERIFVCQMNDNFIGHALLRTDRSDYRSHRAVLMMGIEGPYIGKGIGTKLLKNVLDWAKIETQLEYIDLTVFSANTAAIKLYKKFNFETQYICNDSFRINDQQICEIFMTLKF